MFQPTHYDFAFLPAEPWEILEERGLTVVRARVTGRFPGSPALLTFAFQLEDGRIAALEIGA